jgi:hypothetical protein
MSGRRLACSEVVSFSVTDSAHPPQPRIIAANRSLGGQMRTYFLIGISILTALTISGCAGKGKVPVGYGDTVVHTRG